MFYLKLKYAYVVNQINIFPDTKEDMFCFRIINLVSNVCVTCFILHQNNHL